MNAVLTAIDAASQAVRALHVGEDLERLRRLALRLLIPERVRVPFGPPDPPLPAVSMLLRLPEGQLDVALGAALISAEDQPEIEPETVVLRVEELAGGLRLALRGAVSPEARLEKLNEFFFEVLGMSASPSRGSSRLDEDRLADLLLPHVIRRRRGHCLGLSTLYLALAHRARLPVFGVSAPGHFFVRWDGEGLRRNVELTSRGAIHDDAYYVERFKIRQDLVDRGVYLQSLRRREVLVEVLNNRANFYWDRGDEARVVRDLDRVVRTSQNFAQAYVGRGFVGLHRGNLNRAEKDLARALEIDPDSGRAWLLLGQVRLRRGEFGPAAEALERATEVDGRSALAASYLAHVHHARADFDRALVWHETAIKLDPRCQAAWVHLAQTRHAIGDLEGAKAAYQEALRVAPESLRAREGLVLLARGDDEQIPWTVRRSFRRVCSEYERRLRATPESDRLRAAYLRFLFEAGMDDRRTVDMGRELVERNASPFNLELFGRVLIQAKRPSEARVQLQRALDLQRLSGESAQVERLQAELDRLS